MKLRVKDKDLEPIINAMGEYIELYKSFFQELKNGLGGNSNKEKHNSMLGEIVKLCNKITNGIKKIIEKITIYQKIIQFKNENKNLNELKIEIISIAEKILKILNKEDIEEIFNNYGKEEGFFEFIEEEKESLLFLKELIHHNCQNCLNKLSNFSSLMEIEDYPDPEFEFEDLLGRIESFHVFLTYSLKVESAIFAAQGFLEKSKLEPIKAIPFKEFWNVERIFLIEREFHKKKTGGRINISPNLWKILF